MTNYFDNPEKAIGVIRCSWKHLLNKDGIGSSEYTDRCLEDILSRLQEVWRLYHGAPHIAEGLDLIWEHADDLDDYLSVMRVWLSHDIVWLPDYPDNEMRSAEYHRQMWSQIDTSLAAKLSIEYDAIVSTRDHKVPSRYRGSLEDLHFLYSIDYYSAGIERVAYIRRTHLVGIELGLSDRDRVASNRRWAQSMLDDLPIYKSPLMKPYEAQARKNLQWSASLL